MLKIIPELLKLVRQSDGSYSIISYNGGRYLGRVYRNLSKNTWTLYYRGETFPRYRTRQEALDHVEDMEF